MSPNMTSNTIEKPKRTRLNVAQQIEASRLLSAGHKASVVMQKFSVSRRTITALKKRAPTLLKQMESSTLSLHRKSLRPPAYPIIEERLFQFVHFARSMKMPVTQSVLQHKALMLRNRLCDAMENKECDEYIRLNRFRASIGWVQKFIHRHSLRSGALHGEAGSASVVLVAKEMAQLRERLSAYDVDCIYNVDETGLFYKLLPRKTYIVEEEDRKTVRGTKAMKSKDRITAYVCTNADGTQKLQMAIIGKSKNPRCFRLGHPPVPYFSQRNAWSDTLTFRKWFYDVFLPFIRKTTSRPVALLMDNCGPHCADLKDFKEQVTIMTLPPNCTAIHQPMDLGIIATWKISDRHLLLNRIMADIETRQQRRDSNGALRAGMRGLGEGFEPHMLDVAHMVVESWSKVTQRAIARCWVKSKCLPAQHVSELTASEGKVNVVDEKTDTKDVLKMLEALSLSLDRRDPLYEQVCETVTEEDVENWFVIEENIEISRAVVEDAFISEGVDNCLEPTEELNNSEDDGETVVSALLPSELAFTAQFDALQRWAYDSNMRDASYYLQKAKRCFIERKRAESKKCTRQLLITEVLR